MERTVQQEASLLQVSEADELGSKRVFPQAGVECGRSAAGTLVSISFSKHTQEV